MLSKKRRVKKADFKNTGAKRNGRRYFSENLSLSVLESQKTPARASFVVSSRVSGSAVERNRLKRIGYSTIEKNKKFLDSTGSYVFYFKKGAGNISKEKIRKEVEDLIKSAS